MVLSLLLLQLLNQKSDQTMEQLRKSTYQSNYLYNISLIPKRLKVILLFEINPHFNLNSNLSSTALPTVSMAFHCVLLYIPDKQVEEVMKLSLREVTAKAVEAYLEQPRTEWVLHWPGQVVLASSTIHWTAEVLNNINIIRIVISY